MASSDNEVGQKLHPAVRCVNDHDDEVGSDGESNKLAAEGLCEEGVSEGTTASPTAIDSSMDPVATTTPSPMLVDFGQGGHAQASSTPSSRRLKLDSASSQSPVPGVRFDTEKGRRTVHQDERTKSRTTLRDEPRGQPGELLKTCLQNYFAFGTEDDNRELDGYIFQVFRQLDCRSNNTISREDFDILCEVLGIADQGPSEENLSSSYRHSGLEWLPSYKPRPNSPVSPLRFNRLADVKFKSHGVREKTTPRLHCPPEVVIRKKRFVEPCPSTPPNFLFTFGPRPFWELWPQMRRTKKRLNVDDFKRSLLERWARFNGLPSSQVFNPANGDPSTSDLIDATLPTHAEGGGGKNGRRRDTASDSPNKTRRLMHRVARITRRYRLMERLSKRLRIGRNAGVRCSKSRRKMTISAPLQVSREPPPARRKTAASPPPKATRADVKGGRSSGQLTYLERQVVQQQREIENLRTIVRDLRSSLQLSDAQNLALQVLLKKMSKADGVDDVLPFRSVGVGSTKQNGSVLPAAAAASMDAPDFGRSVRLEVSSSPSDSSSSSTKAFRSKMAETERQLENLVRELKEMSYTMYPQVSVQANNSSSGHSTFSGGGLGYQDFGPCMGTEEEQLVRKVRRQLKEEEAEDAQRVQKQLHLMRSELALTKKELQESTGDLISAKSRLRLSDSQLKETEERLRHVHESRRRLMSELKATRELLSISLTRIHDLDVSSANEAEQRCRLSDEPFSSGNLITTTAYHPLRPLSMLEGSSYREEDDLEFFSEKEADDLSRKETQQLRIDVAHDASLGKRPRPPLPPPNPSPTAPTAKSSPADGRPQTPFSSSGYHSTTGDSKVSPFLASSTPSGSPSHAENKAGRHPTKGSSRGGDDQILDKLRQEIEALKSTFLSSKKRWSEERNSLLEELLRSRQHDESTSNVSADERLRTSILEDKLKEALAILRNLSSSNVAAQSLGRLVLDSVDKSVDPVSEEMQSLRFLNNLCMSGRDYERIMTESQIHSALRAVQVHTKLLEKIEESSIQEEGDETEEKP